MLPLFPHNTLSVFLSARGCYTLATGSCMYVMATTLRPSASAATFAFLDRKSEAPDVRVPTTLSHQTTNLSGESLPYWLVNVPPDRWPAECPSFLRGICEKNIQILSTPDEQYGRQGWELVKEIIRANQINRFQRLPSDLRKYLEYKEWIVAEYGSVMRFVVRERLRWGEGSPDDLKPRGRPFEFDEDIRILYNDWPYGIEKDIIHLVVWTKFELEDDPVTDDLTPQARQKIDNYVKKTFCSRVPSEKVIWFKNWKSLKSVHAVEHFHVMLYKPDPEFLKEITGGDVPMVART